MNFVLLPVLVFAGMTLVAGVAWWLMARNPEQWASWVERENSFWVGKGFISASLAEKMRRWETGKPMKLLLAATTVAGLIGVALTASVLVKAITLAHRKVPVLYNPSFLPKPALRPATNRPLANRPLTNQPPKKATAPGVTNKTVRP